MKPHLLLFSVFVAVAVSACSGGGGATNSLAPGGGGSERAPQGTFIATPSPVPSNAPYPEYIWVDPVNGNDANSGTYASSYKSLQKCANVASAGETCTVKNGTLTKYESNAFVAHITTTGKSGGVITFRAQNTLGVTLDGQNTACESFDLDNAVSYIDIEGFVIQNFTCAGINLNAGSSGEADANTYVTITYNHITKNPGNGIRAGYWSHGDLFEGNEIDNSGYGCTVKGTNQIHGIYIDGYSNTIVSNVFHDNDCGWDIQVAEESTESQGSGFVIVNNTFGTHNNPNGTSNPGQIVFYSQHGTQMSFVGENNIFYPSPTGPPYDCYPATSVSSATLTTNLTGNSQTVGLTNCSSLSKSGSGTLFGTNPQFVSSSPQVAADYRLQSTSPAIGAGTYYAGVTNDFYGSGYSNPPPIGGIDYPY